MMKPAPPVGETQTNTETDMQNHMTEALTLPANSYARLSLEYCQKQQKKSDLEKPRAIEIGNKLKALVKQARSENLTLDDDCVAHNPRAKELRTEIDEILPEFQALQKAALERIAMTKHFSGKVKELSSSGAVEVQVPVNEALVLLEITEPTFIQES